MKYLTAAGPHNPMTENSNHQQPTVHKKALIETFEDIASMGEAGLWPLS